MSHFEDYKEIKSQIRKQRISDILRKTKHMFSVLPEKSFAQNQVIDGPDISTITEHIAFVIDGEVVEIMHCQTKLAAILLSEPQIVKIDDGIFPRPGWKYEDGIFKEPIPEMPEREITTNRDQEAIDHGLPTFKEFQDNMKQMSKMTFKDFMENLRKRKVK